MNVNSEVMNTCTQCGNTWLDKPGEKARLKECPKCDSRYWVSREVKQLEAT